MSFKLCFVSQCHNSSINSPSKLFIRVPQNPKTRKKWMQCSLQSPRDIANTTKLYICEDHFYIKNDMANYMKFKMGYASQIKIKDGVLPSKFAFQESVKTELGECSTPQAVYMKRNKIDLCDCELTHSNTKNIEEAVVEKDLLMQKNELESSENEHKRTDDGLEVNRSEGPSIKMESNIEDELADEPTPSTSYPIVKEEPLDNAVPTFINSFDDLFTKEEPEIS